MSSTTFAIDTLTRHQIHLQRYASGEVNKLIFFLSDIASDVRTRLLQDNLTEFQIDRLMVLRRDINNAIVSTLNHMQDRLVLDLTDLMEYESGFTNRLLDQIVNVETSGIDLGQIQGLLSNSQMSLVTGKTVSNLTLDQAFAKFGGTISNDIQTLVNSGIAQGQTTPEIARDVYRMLNTRTKAQAEALIRTAANHAGNLARSQTYAENSELLDGEKFVATLDGKTTLTCARFDGEIFPVNEGPQPILHWNCRSLRIPIVNPAFTLGRGLTGERASMDGPVNAKRTFGGWLRSQPADFQNEVLGPKRADLFRKGGLSIDKFTDDRGIVYTLKELRALEPQAFN